MPESPYCCQRCGFKPPWQVTPDLDNQTGGKRGGWVCAHCEGKRLDSTLITRCATDDCSRLFVREVGGYEHCEHCVKRPPRDDWGNYEAA